jgi:DNA-binding PucR family transcriptional regulator
VYAGCDLNARRTAAVLGLHPNTVHHRLRKLGELTGRDLRRFEPVQELLVELRILGRPRARG